MTFEDDLLALEARVLDVAAGDFLTAVAELRRMLAAQTPGITTKLLDIAIPQMEAQAKAGVAEAYQMGGGFAVDSADGLPQFDANQVSDARMRLDLGVPADLFTPLDGLDAFLREQKMRAVTLLQSGSPVEEALGPIFRAGTTANSSVVTSINAASNTAAVTVGEAVDAPMVWVNERDSCVYCAALAGKVVERAGDLFPKADAYADGSTGQQTLSQPPLHLHCRCQLQVLGDQSYADSLQREAQRSILRGFSLQSESNAVRVRAAERLLNDPALVAPKSVKEYARKAVKNKAFPRGRHVPVGGPRLIIRDGRGSAKSSSPTPPEDPRTPKWLHGAPRLAKRENLAEAATKTNPHEKDSADYRTNCSYVVGAVELRRRGYDVEARPLKGVGRDLVQTGKDWVDAEGKNPTPKFAGNLFGMDLRTADLPVGARGMVRLNWKGRRGSHVFNWEKTADGLQFVDGQAHDVTPDEVRDYFKQAQDNSVAFIRLDDLTPSDQLRNAVRLKGEQ